MKQILENYNTGAVRIANVPAPLVQPKMVLVRTAASLVSIGTEKAMLDVASKSLLGKALARPDWVRQVVDKVQSDGLLETYRQARARLDMPVPLGYSAAGVVIGVGEGVSGIREGDRVACAGHPYAGHAEIIAVPRNLVVPIPPNVAFEDAAFAMLGAIAMNAVRLAQPALGERVAVIGLGLLGLLALQMLRAAGCRVLAIDISPEKLELAHLLGASRLALAGANVEDIALEFSGGNGVDATLVFASADSSKPVEQAAAITREQGRILVPGLVKLDLPRKVFFEKELRLIVPKAGGPGGADADYEARGKDLPLAFVRWTEGRNLASFLELIGDNRLTVKPLITHRFNIADALEAYSLIQGDTPSASAPVGVILEYPMAPGVEAIRTVRLEAKGKAASPAKNSIGVGLIGAGLFTRGVFLPYFKEAKGLHLRGVATAAGVSGLHAAETAGFEYTTTDYEELLNDAQISTVMITTRHNLHASMVVKALRSGKNVFVEKPLCLNAAELAEVMGAWREAPGAPLLMVGFNRRFAPASLELRKAMGTGPSLTQCRVNAGAIPANSWVHEAEEGGGRAIGEICHFVDLVHSLAGGLTTSVAAMAMDNSSEADLADNLSINLGLDNGSAANIVYAANGDKSFPRERLEIFRAGSVGVIENFRSYSVTKGGHTKRWKALSLDRGHRAELAAFFKGIRDGQPPVAMADYHATTAATFAILESLRSRSVVQLNEAAIVPGSQIRCTY